MVFCVFFSWTKIISIFVGWCGLLRGGAVGRGVGAITFFLAAFALLDCVAVVVAFSTLFHLQKIPPIFWRIFLLFSVVC